MSNPMVISRMVEMMENRGAEVSWAGSLLKPVVRLIR